MYKKTEIIYLFRYFVSKKILKKVLHLKIFYLPLQTDTHSAQTELKHTLLVVYKSIVSH